MKKTLITLALSSFLLGNANACNFDWSHYGDDNLRDMIASQIGYHITEEYCLKFNQKNELFVMFNAYPLNNMAAGHATVGIRKRGSKETPVRTYSHITTDIAGRTLGEAKTMALRATLYAIDDLMSELGTYKVSTTLKQN